MPRLALALVVFALAPLVHAQAGQLVGPVLNATTIVRAGPGLATAFNFGGVCRDSTGAYWTTCTVAGQVLLVRFTAAGASAVIVTGANIGYDLAFDESRDRIWVAADSAAHVYNAVSGQFVGTAVPLNGVSGIAWDGSNRVLIAGSNSAFDAQTLQPVAGFLNMPFATRGFLFDPRTNDFVVGAGVPADPLGVTQWTFRIAPGDATFPPDLSIQSGTRRGGVGRGCEQWLDPSTSEWLGVFAQEGDGSQLFVYTARINSQTGAGCGPVFAYGPGVVQSQLFAHMSGGSALGWLVVSFAPGSFTDPLFAPGCVLHLDPLQAFAFGPVVLSTNGSGMASATVPVVASLRELPLWFQWATINSFTQQVLLSEARAAAVKQF